jgi:hypothetical protein
MTTSWDCFDTLVARRRLEPTTVFDAMGERYGLANFTPRRKSAEARAPWTLESIYNELAKDYQWTAVEKEQYKQAEIDEEIIHCCPVNETIRLVQDGDLIVSDMYLPQEAIAAILKKNGLNKEVSIYVSTGGKSSFRVWPTLPSIDNHVGDNYHSDVASPQSYGIKAMHFTGTQLTQLEKEVGGDLGLLMRVVRLANPYEPGSVLHSMWLEQSQLNIPALILAALELPPTNVAFMMRDSVHLQPIHEALWKEKNVSFHSSRLTMQYANEAFIEYAKNVAFGKTIVDLHGTGQSILNFWQKTFNTTPDLVYLSGILKNGRLLTQTGHHAIELFNSSPLGSLNVFPERKKCEFDERVIKCQADARDCAISHFEHFTFSPNLSIFQGLLKQMENSVTIEANIHICNHAYTID